MACWHAYAKLQLHTEDTLRSFDQVTSDLGVLLRQVAMMCVGHNTTELPRERSARIRLAAKKGLQPGSSGGARSKQLSLSTYKLHALGDYPKSIRERGTTDIYTSRWVWANPCPLSCVCANGIPRSRLHTEPRKDTTQIPINIMLSATLLGEHVVLK